MRNPIENICGIIGAVAVITGAVAIYGSSSIRAPEKESTAIQVELLKEQIEQKEKDREFVLEQNSDKEQALYQYLTNEIQDLNLEINKKDAELKQFLKDCDKIRNAGFILIGSGVAVGALGLVGQHFYDEHC